MEFTVILEGFYGIYCTLSQTWQAGTSPFSSMNFPFKPPLAEGKRHKVFMYFFWFF